ncbi:possible sterol desaturase [Parvularcula bermudensis HTCC2503]|uniref:Possible sterol desaturase n=1 Tax=Parvularcula bermudensis (strain ATCC BAA-594 / HTCC2503 / KCTC 12087) TaxID=314260 RepID=E0TGR9_PARBH|nr:sterol desaturase family protein [Parvularcula bermudensis]ADM10678.1 possible sterol desaturase [Parvularcula bermudensis HTCC2503]
METVTLLKLLSALIVLGGLFFLERLFPVAPRRGGVKRIGKNIGLAGINGLLSPLVIVPIAALAAATAPAWRPAALDGGWGLALDLLLLDLWIYVWHRASHETPFLWRFHEVHHLDEFLDVSSAVRFHFGEVILSALARGAVIFLLDIQLISVLIFDALVLIFAAFHHANVALPGGLERGLRVCVVTPSHHWVHHHRRRADTDSNYGTVLTLWDRIFASFSTTERTPSMPIGTEGRREKSFVGLIARPLSKS